MPILFAYGTLREPRLLEGVLGHGLEGLRLVPATAPGFRTVFYPGRIYPALIEEAGAVAEGTAVAGLTGADMEILDLFEGDEYVRRELWIVLGEGEGNAVGGGAGDVPKPTLNVSKPAPPRAMYYRPLAPIAPDAPEWRLDDWRRQHGEAMIVAEGESAAALRAQLIAMGGKDR